LTTGVLPNSSKSQLPLRETADRLREALRQRKAVVIIGSCAVDYSGRARSRLDYGGRIVLIKQDGALLIHRPYGYLPVNWQPSKCHFHVEYADGLLNLKAIRVSPPETVQMRFKGVYLFSGLDLEDEGRFSLYASELDMKKALIMQPDLIEQGLKIVSSEKRVAPGFADIYGRDRAGTSVIIEIKRDTADREAVLQLYNYVKATAGHQPLRGIIVAPALGKGCQRLLETLNLEFKQLDPHLCSEILARRQQSGRDRSIGEYL